MTQKIIKIGTSAGTIFPKSLLEDFGLKVGDAIRIEKNKKSRVATIHPISAAEEEIVQWTKKFIKRYHGALVALSKK
jgi:antitoxin component of MazEF toxin-antitoxin module